MESIDWSNLSFGYMPTDYNVRWEMGRHYSYQLTNIRNTHGSHLPSLRTRGIRRNESLSG